MQRVLCGPDWVMLSGDDPTGLGWYRPAAGVI
jgi:4-hydroxy-tetrahydrodipicolinate synthase